MGRGMGGSMGPRGFLTDAEKANKPKITGALLKRVLRYLRPYWLQFTLVFIAILAASLLGLLPSLITGRIVDEALIGKDFALLIKLILWALGTLIASRVVGVLESYINAWISSRIVFDMRNEMFAHLQSMPHSFFTTEKQGDIITRMNSDISGVGSVISGTLSSAVSNIAVVITSLYALFALSWQLAIVGVAIVPLLILPTRSVGRTRWKLLTETQAKRDIMNERVNESLSVSGSLLTKLFTQEQENYESYVEINEDVTRLALKEERSGKWFRVMMGIFTQLGPLLIYFAGGLFLIREFDPTVSVGTITATVSLVNRLYGPVQSLLSLQVEFTRSLALFTRIFDYLDKKSDIVNCEDPKQPDISNGDIVFDHVCFSYAEGNRILKDVNFTVPAGKMYAIVGPSGSGKSTIVNLIPRLYDTEEGRVLIGNEDVRNFDIEYLRSRVGVVTQEAYLFNGTIRDNLRIGSTDAEDEQLIEACRAANILDFINSRENGLDTVVGNRGLKLSGGEKQRISLARVILKDPDILILDEATSSLDSISEEAIQTALETVMRGRTSIVIAHRLSTVLAADEIIVVKDGSVVEQGKHDNLLAMDGLYKELYETQFRRVIEHEAEA